ncbi:MAG: GSCFA domain-containing protein [Polyangiaceae bacterium]|nr:GSCFA domain-containing protein [Polyangiaceae bacterium]
MKVIDVTDFVERLVKGDSLDVVGCSTRPGAEPIPVNVVAVPRRGGRRAPLLFQFHGAVDREKRQVPTFQGVEWRGSIRGTFISIADPSLQLTDSLRACWYQGSEHRNVPQEIADLVAACIGRLKPSRVVFSGSSVGAHAALYHSHRVPKSVCVVCNPIVCISRYVQDHIDDYRRTCWPSLQADEPLSKVITDDVSDLYAPGHANAVICLANGMDHHFRRQLAPFLARLTDSRRVAVLSFAFPELRPHDFPRRLWRDWLSAVMGAKSSSLTDLLSAGPVQSASHAGPVARTATVPGSAEASIVSSSSGGASAQTESSPSRDTRQGAPGAHPYQQLPPTAYWRTGVAERHFLDLQDVARPLGLAAGTSIATAGSCFAQHIGRHLRARRANFLDFEPAPAHMTAKQAFDHCYGIYSCRYGNVYSARQILQLSLEALGQRTPHEIVWAKAGRFYDALRPSVEPGGYATAQEVLEARKVHLDRVRAMFEQVGLFIFTLGLTEAWESTTDETVYPSAAGTIVGEFDPSRHRFRNFRYSEIMADLNGFWDVLRSVNPRARLLLTVSPVPLTATASGQHVLVATMQSKSALRAAAGDFAMETKGVDYFPSYELIAAHPGRAMFFNPNMRSVNEAGVEYVMSHFFKDVLPSLRPAAPAESTDPDGVICDEEALEQFTS